MKAININKSVEKGLPVNKPFKLSQDQIEALTKVSQAILAVVAVAGVLVLAAAAPNVFYAIDRVIKMTRPGKKWSKAERKAKIKRAFYYLKQSGLIRLNNKGEAVEAVITEKGREKLTEVSLKTTRVFKSGKWNGRWWLVVADIPTKEYRYQAELFRKQLKQMGFYALQRTVWLYPFSPINAVQLVAEYFGIEKYITVMEVLRVDKEDEKRMKMFFQASRTI